MQYRTFAAGVRVSALGIGCGRVGSLNNPVPMREIESAHEAAVEAGVTLFDTADVYGQGDSERALRLLRKRHPGRIFVVTKIGYTHGPLASAVRLAKPLLRAMLRPRPQARSAVLQARAKVVSQNFSTRYLREAVDRSRRRLGVDCLDGLLLHDPPCDVLRSSEIRDLLSDLVQRQMVSHVGVSPNSVEEVKTAVSIPSVTMLEVSLSCAMALSGTPLVDQMRDRNVALFAREILRWPDSERRRMLPAEALSAALAPPFVTSAVVGVSTRAHLNDLLPVVA